jgi:hypothetical protein
MAFQPREVSVAVEEGAKVFMVFIGSERFGVISGL